MTDLLHILSLAWPPIAAGAVVFVINIMYKTKREILERLEKAVSEEKVVQLIDYRFGPLTEDIKEIKQGLQRVQDQNLKILMNEYAKHD